MPSSEHKTESRHNKHGQSNKDLGLASGQAVGSVSSFTNGGSLVRLWPVQPGVWRLHEPQQHALIRRMEQIHGNQHVQRAIEQGPAGAPSGEVVQRRGGSSAGGVVRGAIAKAEAQKARAKDILATAFGSVCKIKAPKVVILDTTTLKRSYVQFQIRQGGRNSRKGRPWQESDADEIQRLDGYADRGANTVYVADQGDEAQIATLVHEMLHANANPGFPGTYLTDFDEGATEYLARVALARSGIQAPTGGTYGRQVGLITLFVDMVGQGTLIQAYFNNPAALKNMVDTIRGPGTWNLFWIRFMDKRYKDAWELLYPKGGGSWVDHKIKLIKGYLEGWVSDDDISMIETICGTLSSEDRKTVRRAISPQIGSLWSHGQRARLRMALGA